MRIKRSREDELSKKIEKQYNDNSGNIIIGIFILLFGIMLGITINSNSTFALDTASSNNATASNATDSNATASNATNHNATDSNATDNNATASNAVNTDNIIYLNDISLSKNTAKAGEKIYVNKSTSGACNTAMSITFKEVTTGNTFSANIESINDNAYIVIPNNIISGNYEVSNLFVVGLNSDNTTFTKKYINSKNNTDNNSFNFNIKLNITGNEENKVELSKLTLSNTSAKVGDKVSLTVLATQKLSSLKLIFKSNNNNSFEVSVSDLTSNPYFVIPSSSKSDTYYLHQATIASADSTNIYINGVNYKFNTNLEVKESNEVKSFTYNNKDINDEIIKKIYNGNDELEVTINANDDSVISSELFNSIKGTKKKLIINYKDNQIIFCGNDIEESKSIDASISTNIVKKDADISKLINEGVVINFSSNGNLPGAALVRIKITDEMKNAFGNSKIYVYYYNEDSNKFNAIDENISADNGYYEFTIRHNSKYVLTNTEIDNNLITTDTANIVGFQKSNKTYIAMIVLSILLIAAVTALIIFIKKDNTKNRKKPAK